MPEALLGADIRTYLPEFPDYGSPILVSDLIHHTSGVRDDLSLWLLLGHTAVDAIPHAERVSFLRAQSGLNFEPGSDFFYSNGGYKLLAEIVERQSGEKLRAFLAQRVFEPLGMTDTFVADDAGEFIRERAFEYTFSSDGRLRQDRLIWGGSSGPGGVWSTPRDLLRWSREMLHPKVFDPALVRRVQTPGHLRDGTELPYAFGLYALLPAGRAAIAHGGSGLGFRANMAWFAGEDASIILLTNQPSDVGQLNERLADIFLNDGIGADGEPVATPASQELQGLTGYWATPWGPAMEISVVDGGLQRLQNQGPDTPRKQLATFFADGSFRFEGPDVFRLSADGQRLEATRRSTPTYFATYERAVRHTPSPAELAQLEGCYRSRDLDATWRLTLRSGVLTREMLGVANAVLEPAARDVFEMQTGLKMTIDRDRNGRPSRLLVTPVLGRVRNLAFERIAC